MNSMIIIVVFVILSVSAFHQHIPNSRKLNTARDLFPWDKQQNTGVKIIDAVLAKNENGIKELLQASNVKVVVNEKDFNGNNALHIISKKGISYIPCMNRGF